MWLKRCEEFGYFVKKGVQKILTFMANMWNSDELCRNSGKIYTKNLFILPFRGVCFPEFTQTSTITTTYYRKNDSRQINNEFVFFIKSLLSNNGRQGGIWR